MDYENIGKDRSLGMFEVNLSELARFDPTNERTPYVSTGRKSREEKLQQKNGSFKGSLQYDIDFCPAFSLRGQLSSPSVIFLTRSRELRD
jgi:Ca2+-dependent lipid-binding protein